MRARTGHAVSTAGRRCLLVCVKFIAPRPFPAYRVLWAVPRSHPLPTDATFITEWKKNPG